MSVSVGLYLHKIDKPCNMSVRVVNEMGNNNNDLFLSFVLLSPSLSFFFLLGLSISWCSSRRIERGEWEWKSSSKSPFPPSLMGKYSELVEKGMWESPCQVTVDSIVEKVVGKGKGGGLKLSLPPGLLRSR